MRLIGLATVAALTLVACAEDSTGPGAQGHVTVANNFFSPASTSPDTNGVVTFQWGSGGVQHTVTWEDAATGTVQGTGQFTRDFSAEAPNTYRYRCTIHSTTFGSGMSGQVVVP